MGDGSYGSVSSGATSLNVGLSNVVNEEGGYHLYKRRWVMLLFYSVLGLVNNACWINFAAIPDYSEAYFGVGINSINLLSLVFLVSTVIFTIPASYICDRFGIVATVWFGGTCNLVGALVRFTCVFLPTTSGVHLPWIGELNPRFAVLLLGQSVLAIGQPAVLPAPPKLANRWFGDHERTIATSIAALSTVSGIALGYGIAIGVVSSSEDLPRLLFITALSVVVTAIPAMLGYREHPPTPPSPSGKDELEGQGLFKDIATALQSRGYIVILLTLGPGYGVLTAVFSLMFQLVSPYGYSQLDSGWFGIVLICSGIFGAGALGALVDETRAYRPIIIVGFLCAILAMLNSFLAVMIEGPFWMVMIGFGMSGFFLMALLPIAMEAAVEVTYPCPEAVLTGVLLLVGNLFGVGIFVAMQFIPTPWSLWFATGVGFLCFLGSFFFKGRYKRLEFEQLALLGLTGPPSTVTASSVDRGLSTGNPPPHYQSLDGSGYSTYS
eukprot:TRINITY_DN6317_c0_g1_i2.p1 TRINITY_DN6317_c0_g1~~TRINITY_DN6317_c0_g1_i2.p1  ORF type:complete len:528 (+),score=75.56 TRINITY_DN6317_c0_g1_i2:104-1585(+)